MCNSCKIRAMTWDKHHQMSFRSKNDLFISIEHEISTLIQLDVPCKQRNNVGPTYWNRATVRIPCSHTQQDSAWIEPASWLSLIPFWLVAHYIIFSTSHFFSWSSSSHFYNCKPCPPKHFLQRRLEPNHAERQALHATTHLVRHSSNADTSLPTATLQL